MRRNWAYGLPVDQHDLKFYTLMAYANYQLPNGDDNGGCDGCVHLPVFSSPDLWWFFNTTDTNHGYCLVIDDTDTTNIQLQCQNPAPPWCLPIRVTTSTQNRS